MTELNNGGFHLDDASLISEPVRIAELRELNQRLTEVTPRGHL